MGWISELKKTYEVYRDRDPAIRTYWDVLLYPCYHAIRAYRRAHRHWVKGHTFRARWISQRAARKTGIEIHPGAVIGEGFFIDHGTGVVIGETTIIGNNVTLYQGVTLGGTGKEQGKRHPTLEDGVMVSAGAKILGSFTVGENSKIGAGSVVLNEVPPNCTVVGVPGRVVRMKDRTVPRETIDQIHLPDPILQDLKALRRENKELSRRQKEMEKEIEALREAQGLYAGSPAEAESAEGQLEESLDERDYEDVGDCVFADGI